MDLSVLKYEVKDNVATITMNNPPVNALTEQFLEDFDQVINRLKDKGEARAVIVTSACSGFFSVGDDITTLKEINDDLIKKLPKAHAMLKELETLPLPTIAAINGFALGGGLELALVCDFRFMAIDSGAIGLPEVLLGLMPALGGTQRLPQVVGKAKAIEMMYKGLQLKPEEAKEIGLVNDVYSKEDLQEKCFEYALELSQQATGAIGRIKTCIAAGINQGLDNGLAVEMKTFKENIFTDDAKEGINAFLERRQPEFKG